MITRRILLFLFATASFVCASPDWKNEQVFEQNKLPARVPSYSYQSQSDALAGERSKSRMRSLNGVWKFKYVAKEEERPDIA